jgi:predicted PurR-regulated permease PerM
MSNEGSIQGKGSLTAQVVEVVIRLGLILFLVVWAFQIITPFLQPVLWGAILAVALYPLFNKVCGRFGGRRKMVGTVFILLSVALIIVPSVMLVSQSIEGVQAITEKWQEGAIEVPPPNEKVKEWPAIGKKVYKTWDEASTNLEATMKKFGPQLKALGAAALGRLAGVGGTTLGFVFSLIICGVLMISGEKCTTFLHALGERLVGKSGGAFVGLATKTVRSVALGVVGTAFIQACMAALGLVIMGIPLAAVWAFLVLMVAIIQLPPILILGPIAAWAYSTSDPVPATIFLVWCLFTSFADGLLKPMLLGRGMKTPMLVILIGALGGMITSGMMGLFVGAVILALAYNLFLAWLGEESLMEAAAEEEGA